jgi:hypothetical protein
MAKDVVQHAVETKDVHHCKICIRPEKASCTPQCGKAGWLFLPKKVQVLRE